MANARDFRLDNVRGALIFLVVFCHLLVSLPHGPLVSVLYQVIYLFHMPAFVFVTGYFARFRPKKIARSLLLPYVVFQLLASVRRNVVAGRVWFAGLTLLYPQWTLWYLLACVLWYLTIPLLEHIRSRKAQVGIVLATMGVSFVCGFAPWLGEFMDLARVVALFPFFCAGYWAGRARLSARLDARPPQVLVRLRAVSALVLLALMALHYAHGPCPAAVLYRDTPFSSSWDFVARIIVQLVAAAWCLFLFVWMPQRSLGRLSVAGRNTMSVYLLHPWIIRILRHVPIPNAPEPLLVGACAVVAACILLLLGNDRVGTAFRALFGGVKKGNANEGTAHVGT